MRQSARIGLYIGVVAIVLGLSKLHAAQIAAVPYSWHTSSRFTWSIAYMLALIVASYAVGLPDLVRTRRSALVASIAAAVAGAGAISVVQLATGDALLPRFVVFGTALVFVPWSMACAAVAGSGRRSGLERDRVLLVGTPDSATMLASELDQSPERPATLIGHLAVSRAEPTGSGFRPVIDAVHEGRATVLVLDHDAQAVESVVAQAADLHEEGLRIRPLADFYEQWLGKLPMTELEHVSMLFDIGELHRARYARIKRVLDLPIALGGMVPFVLSVPFVAMGNLVANRGPLFYRQTRVGMAGRQFTILKFRTMRPDPDAATAWTTDGDDRVTRFGAMLRRWHVDEIPQMWNILRGDLAVVGPRPEQPHYVEELSEKLAFYDLRHLVHPGLTGWAQVKYGYAGDEQDALEKLQYDFFYLRHQNLRLDLRILARTTRSVISRGGR